jgi:hypothetical protein
MNKKLINKYTIATLVSLIALMSLFMLVNPENKPLPYIFGPVLLAWVFLYSLSRSILSIIYTEDSRVRSLIVFVSVSLVVLLGLLSGVGQLSVSDVILAFSLVAVSTFYFYRMWS